MERLLAIATVACLLILACGGSDDVEEEARYLQLLTWSGYRPAVQRVHCFMRKARCDPVRPGLFRCVR